MYTELVLFRNELKNKSIPKYKIIGIVSELLLSKQIFKRNKDIEKFLKEVFELELKEYLFKSRTLLVSKVIREIMCIENENLYKNKLYKFVQEKINDLKDDSIKKEKNQFDGWIQT